MSAIITHPSLINVDINILRLLRLLAHYSKNPLIKRRAKHLINTGKYIDSGGFFKAICEGRFYDAMCNADKENAKVLKDFVTINPLKMELFYEFKKIPTPSKNTIKTK